MSDAGAAAGMSMVAAAIWMFVGSRYGKTRERERLLNRIAWTLRPNTTIVTTIPSGERHG